MSRRGLDITVLGCSGSYAAPGGACTGFLVQSQGANVLLDCGPGTLGNLQKVVSLEELDAIVITHEHADHWLELLLVYAAINYYEPRRPLPLFTTIGTQNKAKLIQEDVTAPFVWEVLADGDQIEIADQAWSFHQTEHYVETLATRISAAGRVLGFTADTGPGWAASALGADIDVLLAESTFLSDSEPEGILHLSARQAGLAGVSAEADRLLLTHLAPGSDPDAHLREAAEAFGGPVEVARLGATYAV